MKNLQALLKNTKGPSLRQKLSKKFLFDLPENVYIVSNLGMPPIFQGHVCGDRNELWARIKASGADGRLCAVFNNHGEYLRRCLPI